MADDRENAVGSDAQAAAPEPARRALPELAAARDPTMPHVVRHDIETYSTVDLKVTGAAKYAADPSTEILCVAYAVDDEAVQLWLPGDPAPPEFIEVERNPLWTIEAHNDGFERPIARHVLEPRHGFPAIPLERRRCSMAMAYAAALPGSLEKAVDALGLPYPKDKAGQALMRRMSKPQPDGSRIDDPASHERLHQYIRRDVEAERAVSKALPPLTADEQKLWELDATINDRGFAVDVELLEAAHKIVLETEVKLQAEFRELTGLDSTDQVKKLIAWLAAHDCVVDDVQKATLSQALRRKGLGAEVRRAIELRRQLAHASAMKVEALLAWRHADNRVRGTLGFHIASTGRWAGRGPQPQNFKRDSEGIDAKIAAVMAGGAGLDSPVEAVGDIARGMIVAAPGHRLLIGDFSGIESRILAWISGQLSKLEQWEKFDRTGTLSDDPYFVQGRACGLAETIARAKGKICDLAFGFQGGLGAWKAQAPDDDPLTDDDIKRYQQNWKAQHPHTVAFWKSIDRNAIAAVSTPGKVITYKRLSLVCDGNFLRITLPSGRALSYPFPRIEIGKKFGDPRVIFKDASGGKWSDCRFGQGSYGGLWTENIVSALARDVLAAAMRRLEAAGYPIVLTVHDEVVCEVPDGFGTLEEFGAIITAKPDWVTGTHLPIAAKVRESARFSNPDSGRVVQLRPVAPAIEEHLAEAPGVQESEKDLAVVAVATEDISIGPAPAPASIAGDAGPRLEVNGAEPPWSNELSAVVHRALAEIHNMQSAPIGGNGNGAKTGNGATQHGNGRDRGASEQSRGGSGGSDRGDYNYRASEKHADKPYGPVRSQLSMLGYLLARTFPFTVPGETEPLFYEDRYELRPGMPPTADLPAQNVPVLAPRQRPRPQQYWTAARHLQLAGDPGGGPRRHGVCH